MADSSVISMRGFVGVSIKIILVFGRSDLSTSSMRVALA